MGSANSHLLTPKGKSMAILFVGIDLAKNVFAVHGVDDHGKAVLVRSTVQRAKLHELIASLPPCTVGMEACSGAHHWARLFKQHGHTLRLMAPKFVSPYRMSGARGKNDAADAAAICEAVQRPNMHFVPVKSEDEQARLCVHRVRQGFVEQRTATINRLRGLLSEFGIILPQKAATVRREATAHLEDLPGWANTAVGDSLSEVHRLDERLAEYDRHVSLMAANDERSRRLMQLQGVGCTTASALVSTSATHMTSRMDGSLQRGSAWCPVSTAPAARPGSEASPRPVIATSERSSCWERSPFSPQPRTRATGSAAGPWRFRRAAATGEPSSRSQRRTLAWLGPCLPRERASNPLRPEPRQN
jgi:transposase